MKCSHKSPVVKQAVSTSQHRSWQTVAF